MFGGIQPYEQAMASGLVYRVYLTRIFAEYPCDTYWSSLDLSQFRRIQRSKDEILAELDEKMVLLINFKFMNLLKKAFSVILYRIKM